MRRSSSSSSSSSAMNMNIVVCFLFLAVLCVQDSSSAGLIEPRRKLMEFQQKVQAKAAAATTTTTSTPPLDQSKHHSKVKNMGRVFYPIGYGADPSGASDSFDAIMEAINDACQVESGLELLPGVKDLGGVVIDLLGGNYIISQPLLFPPAVGNILVHGGTIRASPNFPGDRHLIELCSPSSQKLLKTDTLQHEVFGNVKLSQNVGIYYEDITFRDILFDSSMRGGGLFVIDSARIRIDHCFFIHFTTEGILVQKGHETFIISSFLGQQLTIGGDKREKFFTGTAIDLASNDNAVTDVAIFSAATGVILRGQANILTGVHCYNKATYWGGVGILVKLAGLSQTRIDSCYMDYTAIVMEDPVQVHVSNAFFLGDANIVLKSINGKISGLNIVNNMFNGGSTNPIVKLEGQFTNIDQAIVGQNNVHGSMTMKSTIGRLTIAGNGTKWVADFSNVLLFPNKINHVQYSFFDRGQKKSFASHAVTNVSSNVVTVESNIPVNAAVSVVVDQFNLLGETNALL